MTDLHLQRYTVTLQANDERHTIKVYAPGKRQAGISAAKQARVLLEAKSIEIRRIRKTAQ